jgi:transposase, IS6 family
VSHPCAHGATWKPTSSSAPCDGIGALRCALVMSKHSCGNAACGSTTPRCFAGGPRDAPELDRRCRPSLRATHESDRVEATDITITQPWHDLYRAVDSVGATLDFMVSATRDADAAERVFREGLQASHTRPPRVITVDTHAASPLAFDALQREGTLPQRCLRRQGQDLNTMVERDHRFVKRRVNLGLGCGAFATAQRTIQGDEAMPMLHTGPLEGVTKGDVLAQNRVINQVFGWAASRALASLSSPSHLCWQHNLTISSGPPDVHRPAPPS